MVSYIKAGQEEQLSAASITSIWGRAASSEVRIQKSWWIAMLSAGVDLEKGL